MYKTIRNTIIGAAALGMSILNPSIGYADLKLNLEASVSQGQEHLRLWLGDTGYKAMLDFYDGKHRGRHAFSLGEGSDLGVLVLKTNEEGVGDVKIGFRTTRVSKALGGKGFLDLTTDEESGNITALHTQKFDEYSLTAFGAIEKPYGGKSKKAYWLQLNKDLDKKTSVFFRQHKGGNRFVGVSRRF